MCDVRVCVNCESDLQYKSDRIGLGLEMSHVEAIKNNFFLFLSLTWLWFCEWIISRLNFKDSLRFNKMKFHNEAVKPLIRPKSKINTFR